VNTREMVMAGATGIIVASALGWTFVIRPTIDSWREANDRIATLQEQKEKAIALIKRKGDLQAERNKIDSALSTSDDYALVPRAPGETWDANAVFLEHLRDLLGSANLPPPDLRSVRADPYDAYAELHYELRTRAHLRELKDFLVKMTASEAYIRVQAFQIQPQLDGRIEVSMSLVGLANQDALEEDQIPKTPGRRPK